MTCTAPCHFGPEQVMQMAFAAMTAILFLQSGLDKALDYAGNRAYLTEHFSKSPLKGTVPVLLPVITVIELAAGAFSAAGLLAVLLGHGPCLGRIGMGCAVTALTLLFFGQRLAKDYAGAASIIPYFLMAAAGLYFFLQC